MTSAYHFSGDTLRYNPHVEGGSVGRRGRGLEQVGDAEEAVVAAAASGVVVRAVDDGPHGPRGVRPEQGADVGGHDSDGGHASERHGLPVVSMGFKWPPLIGTAMRAGGASAQTKLYLRAYRICFLSSGADETAQMRGAAHASSTAAATRALGHSAAGSGALDK